MPADLPDVSCRAERGGRPCGERCQWRVISHHGKQFTVAMCTTHAIAGYQLDRQRIRTFPYAKSLEAKAFRPLGTHPPKNGPCVGCGASDANKSCHFWLCKKCCVDLCMPCLHPEHKQGRLAKHPNRPVHPPVDFKISSVSLPPLHDGGSRPAIAGPSRAPVPPTRPAKRPASPTAPSHRPPARHARNHSPSPDNVIIISDSDDDLDSGADVDNGAGDKVILNIECVHQWAANPVRKAGEAKYHTVIAIPRRRDLTVRADEIPPHALEDLRLGDIGFECLRIWAGDGHCPAFAESDDCARYKWLDQASLMALLALSVTISGLEVGRHVPLEPEEFQTDQDWQLGILLLNITCTQYSHGYKSGDTTTFRVACRVPRRRINIDDCVVRLCDLNATDLGLLGISPANVNRVEGGFIPTGADGQPRAFDMQTPLLLCHGPRDAENEASTDIELHGPGFTNPVAHYRLLLEK